MMKFSGKIQGVQLFDMSSIKSMVRIVGHLENGGSIITIETSRERAKEIVDTFGVDDVGMKIEIGEIL